MLAARLHALALKAILDILAVQAQQLAAPHQPVPADLAPAPLFARALAALRELLLACDSAAVPMSARGAEFDRIMDAALRPLLLFVETAQSDASAPLAEHVYAINCLYAVQTTLALFETTASYTDRVQEALQRRMDALMMLSAQLVLQRSGLSALPTGTAADDALAVAASAALAMAQFEAFVANLQAQDFMSAARGYEQLTSARLRGRIRARVADSLMSAYRRVYASATAADSAARRTPEQVALLLGH